MAVQNKHRLISFPFRVARLSLSVSVKHHLSSLERVYVEVSTGERHFTQRALTWDTVHVFDGFSVSADVCVLRCWSLVRSLYCCRPCHQQWHVITSSAHDHSQCIDCEFNAHCLSTSNTNAQNVTMVDRFLVLIYSSQTSWRGLGFL